MPAEQNEHDEPSERSSHASDCGVDVYIPAAW
jgi:hypothetical protein